MSQNLKKLETHPLFNLIRIKQNSRNILTIFLAPKQRKKSKAKRDKERQKRDKGALPPPKKKTNIKTTKKTKLQKNRNKQKKTTKKHTYKKSSGQDITVPPSVSRNCSPGHVCPSSVSQP